MSPEILRLATKDATVMACLEAFYYRDPLPENTVLAVMVHQLADEKARLEKRLYDLLCKLPPGFSK